MVTFPVGLCLCCSVLTSGQAGASHIYLSPVGPGLTKFWWREEEPHIWMKNKSFIIELCLPKPYCPSMEHWFWTFMLAICENKLKLISESKMWKLWAFTHPLRQLVKIWSAAVRLLLLEEHWLCRCTSGQCFAFCMALRVICELYE